MKLTGPASRFSRDEVFAASPATYLERSAAEIASQTKASRVVRKTGWLMDPITGSANITLGAVTVAPVTPPQAYFGAAEAIMHGVRQLATSGPEVCVPLTLLAGQMLECLLKAYLSKHGAAESDLKQHTVRHNLKELWLRANQSGLPNDSTPPQWVECLSGLHNSPFYLRYPMGLNGLVLPGVQLMASELESLLEAVRRGPLAPPQER